MTDDYKIFLSKLGDMVRRADSGRFAVSAFLTPEEIAIAQKHLSYESPNVRFAFYGGYPEAERKILVLFPDYAEKDDFDEGDHFQSLLITSGGYSRLTHSSYLGAIMNCSVERSSIGDICVRDDSSAVIFATTEVAKLLTTQNVLERVGREKVSVTYCSKETAATIKREYEESICTVASERIDCLVSEITSLSREKVKAVIARADVMKNHLPVTDPAERFAVSDILSVRGEGKYVISKTEPTKKGRVRVYMLKYK